MSKGKRFLYIMSGILLFLMIGYVIFTGVNLT